MSEMKDCGECKHSTKSYNALLCLAMNMPKPVEYMRDDRSECGLAGYMYEPKSGIGKYSEFDED